jgi:hypothetical protein
MSSEQGTDKIINNNNKLLGGKRKRMRSISSPQLQKPDISTIKPKNLKYTIDSWNSYVNNFHPNNILIDGGGSISKWSAEKSKNEYVYLKLERTAIVSIVTFGKHRDPTNLKEFKILAGLDKSNMIEVLHSGLSNDNDYESFTVSYTVGGIYIPCK